MTARTDRSDLGRYSPAYATGREFGENCSIVRLFGLKEGCERVPRRIIATRSLLRLTMEQAREKSEPAPTAIGACSDFNPSQLRPRSELARFGIGASTNHMPCLGVRHHISVVSAPLETTVKISTGKVKSAYRGGRIPLQGTWHIPTGDIVHLHREGAKGLTLHPSRGLPKRGQRVYPLCAGG